MRCENCDRFKNECTCWCECGQPNGFECFCDMIKELEEEQKNKEKLEGNHEK